MNNPYTVKALIIYEDRVQTYRKMKVLDEKLDNKPTAEMVMELAELRIQNLLCFSELQNLNDNEEFIYKHPYLKNQRDYDELIALWKSDREQFIRNYQNCKNNISRYNGRANRPNATESEIEDALQRKQRHEERAIIFKKILTNESESPHS